MLSRRVNPPQPADKLAPSLHTVPQMLQHLLVLLLGVAPHSFLDKLQCFVWTFFHVCPHPGVELQEGRGVCVCVCCQLSYLSSQDRIRPQAT